jgi:ketosteroid isomerase-like protein
LPQKDLVRRFYEAFDAQDIAAFIETLHPHVELQTARGLRIGLDEARSWATKAPHGGLEQRYVIEDLLEKRNHVVALVRQQWWWREGGLAEDNERAAVFTFEDGLIARWQPFSDRAEALRAAGIDAGGD